MEMKYTAIITIFLLFSCAEKSETYPSNDFGDKVVNFSIQNSNDTYVELPELYDRTKSFIPEDADENVILVEKLIVRGFKVIHTNRTNQQLSGRRIFTQTLLKENCQCEVAKIYYTTANISEYIVSERIKCNNIID